MHAAGELGDDVRIKTGRGDRNFAAGDRIMFLRNERGLEVKNGTLGTIERVSESSMAVRTDDGRSVAFEDRKSVVSGKRVSVRVDLGGRRTIKKNNKNKK